MLFCRYIVTKAVVRPMCFFSYLKGYKGFGREASEHIPVKQVQAGNIKLTLIIFRTRDERKQGAPPKGPPELCQTCQWPCRTAQRSGTTPLLLALLTAAPCPSSNLHTSSFPLPAAAVSARESIGISISSWLI